jgi:hypothetical protein
MVAAPFSDLPEFSDLVLDCLGVGADPRINCRAAARSRRARVLDESEMTLHRAIPVSQAFQMPLCEGDFCIPVFAINAPLKPDSGSS